MTESALSVIDDVEPPKHDDDYLNVLRKHQTAAAESLAHLRAVKLYDETEIPGVTRGDLRGNRPATTTRQPGKVDGNSKAATLWDHTYGDMKQNPGPGEPKQPARGAQLAAEIAALEQQLTVLEAEITEQEALADAHQEWERRQSSDMHLRVAVPNGLDDETVLAVRDVLDKALARVHAALGQAVADEGDAAEVAA